jgi:hypothetical protein
MVGVVVTAAAALAAGYLLGRLRPWQRLGDWAPDQVRFTEAWVRSCIVRQAVVVLVHAVTAPRTSWRMMRAPAPRHGCWRPYATRTGSPTAPGESTSRRKVTDSLSYWQSTR